MKYSQEVKDEILKEVKEVGNVKLVARKHGIPPSTINTWIYSLRNKPQIDKDKETKALKKKLADAELENKILRDLLKKTYQVWDKD